MFLRSSVVHSMHECVNRCCGFPECDVAMLRDHVCYTVQCYSKESCSVAGNGDFQVSYITRIGKCNRTPRQIGTQNIIPY